MKRITKLAIFLIVFMIVGSCIYQTEAEAAGKTKTYKKTIRLYLGKTKKIKAKGINRGRKVKIKNTGKSKVQASYQKSGYIILKSKKLGSANIKVKYKSGKKKYIYKMKVKVIKESQTTTNKTETNASTGSSVSTGSSTSSNSTKSAIQNVKYHYELKVLTTGTIYNEALVYVKTDNPDRSFYFEKDGCITGTLPSRYANLPVTDYSTGKVEGGYLVSLSLNENSVTCFELYENQAGSFGNDTGIRLTINSGNYSSEEDAWLDLMLSRAKEYVALGVYTSTDGSEMTLPVEEKGEEYCLLRALQVMVLDEFKYLRIYYDSENVEKILMEYDVDTKPYWEIKYINCLESTHIMRKFADKLGLENESTYAGYLDHHYATVTIDGTKYIFDACPYSKENIVENNSWSMLDIANLPNNSNATITY
ncbi:MAG: hypothetical protein K6G11_09160 [Lachnospiraceae bacterium]|nr:hypothetical protein [Lachnospiraceae bacterium]